MGNDQKKPLREQTSSGPQYHSDIVVVSTKSKDDQVNEELSQTNKLEYVPLFYPILKSSINLKEDKILQQINYDQVLRLCQEFKSNMNNNAFNITKDQEAIFIEVKNLNLIVDLLMNNFYEKQKKYAKYCEQFKAVSDVSNSLKKVQRDMDEILPMIKEINSFLPDEDKLEEFTFE
jgi:hypothetical protein